MLAEMQVVDRVRHCQRRGLPGGRVGSDQGLGLGNRGGNQLHFTESCANLRRENQRIDESRRITQRAKQFGRAQ